MDYLYQKKDEGNGCSMLADFLTTETIKVQVQCNDWQAAFKAGAELLEKVQGVGPDYGEAIIRYHLRLGPYMVVAPGIVLAHARPQEGVLKTSMSMMTLQSPIFFGNSRNDPVRLVITFAAVNDKSHLRLLADLMELLMNPEEVQSIIQAQDIQEVLAVIARY